jgi:hypothetical protein
MRDQHRNGRLASWACLLLGTLVLSGCESVWKSPEQIPPAVTFDPPALPGKADPQRVSQFVFYSDTPIKSNAPLFEELSQLRDQIYSDLQLPPSNSVIQVYLFDNQEHYERFMGFRYPNLPKRRAFFIAQPRASGGSEELLVYTFWGDHIRQDLRHELTHGLLHSVLKEVPIWLDEGLAEYYELSPEKGGLNSLHMEALRRSSQPSDLDSLERLTDVKEMGRTQYQESWAWVHWMLRGDADARQVLLVYLQQLRGPGAPGLLMPRLREVVSDPSASYMQHLARIDPPSATIRQVRERR